MLPSSMHTPWAESKSYNLSELNTIQGGVASPCLSSSLPFCVRFNRALPLEIQLYSQAATHDTKPLAKSYLGGNHSHLPSNHFQYARAWFCSGCFSCSCSVRQDGARARNRLTDCTRSVIPQHNRCLARMALYFGDVLDRKAIDVKPIMIEEVVGHDCLDSITSTSTVSLSTSTMLLLHARTTGITEHEELTQRRSKRTTECFACMPLLCDLNWFDFEQPRSPYWNPPLPSRWISSRLGVNMVVRDFGTYEFLRRFEMKQPDEFLS